MASSVSQIPTSFEVPYKSAVVTDKGFVSNPWVFFFRTLRDLLKPLGEEKSFNLENNQITPANIEGLAFSSTSISQVTVEYLIQRITTGTNATELIEVGTFMLVFRPVSLTWVLVPIGSSGPDASGITLSVTSDGQVQFVSTNIYGEPSISRIAFRARSMGAKSSTYSTVGPIA